MENHKDAKLHDEGNIFSLEAYRKANSLPDDKPPGPTKDGDRKAGKDIRAGRRLAMRRSARWAA
jgi:hypothetical protein